MKERERESDNPERAGLLLLPVTFSGAVRFAVSVVVAVCPANKVQKSGGEKATRDTSVTREISPSFRHRRLLQFELR